VGKLNWEKIEFELGIEFGKNDLEHVYRQHWRLFPSRFFEIEIVVKNQNFSQI